MYLFMNRYALKFGYIGKNFYGYQRQPNFKTVEGDILNACFSTGIIKDYKNANFKSASRTDKGVSALGNVLAVNTDFRKNEIIQALNSHIQDIWFYKIAQVDTTFNPRHAIKRIYRYHLSTNKRNINVLIKATDIFIGEHDFKYFCYNVKDKNTVRTITRIDVNKSKNFITIDFEAPNFLWGMVRMIIAAILSYENNKTNITQIEKVLLMEKKNHFGIALPEPLLLVDISYDFCFEKTHVYINSIDDLEQRLYLSDLQNQFYSSLITSLSDE